MLLTYHELVSLAEHGVIDPVPMDHINAASIDVTLGRWVWTEDPRGGDVKLAEKGVPGMVKHDLLHADYSIRPGEFVLAQTHEMFNLPDDIAALFLLRSSMARSGLEHSEAGWADPGFNGSVLTLELRNNLMKHTLVISYGLRVGQMVFFKGDPVPSDRSYRAIGRYNGDSSSQPSKGA